MICNVIGSDRAACHVVLFCTVRPGKGLLSFKLLPILAAAAADGVLINVHKTPPSPKTRTLTPYKL
jgi:hypothetical protein